MEGRLITICNYSTYQNYDNETNNYTNKELTKPQQSTNKEITTNKNEKKDKKDKNLKDGWMENRDDEISLLWIKTFGKQPNLIEREETQKLLNQFGKQKVEKEFREAIINGAKSLRYVINTLTNSNGGISNYANNHKPKTISQQRLEYKLDPEKYNANLEHYKKLFG